MWGDAAARMLLTGTPATVYVAASEVEGVRSGDVVHLAQQEAYAVGDVVLCRAHGRNRLLKVQGVSGAVYAVCARDGRELRTGVVYGKVVDDRT